MKPSFACVTELPGLRATREQCSMLYTRYHLAGTHSVGKDVLEVACGAGLGLGYLARSARSVTGVDIDETNLRVAAESYRGREQISLRVQDAQNLDYADGSFDAVLLYEAIYYLPDAERFVAEARRLLRPGGKLIVCTVNRRWQGFNPSPHSRRYYDADELRRLLARQHFEVRLFGGFKEQSRSPVKAIVSLIRSCAVRLHLIPGTMKSKQWLKRMFYGRLTPLAREVQSGMAPLAPLTELTHGRDSSQFKVLYVVAKVAKQASRKAA